MNRRRLLYTMTAAVAVVGAAAAAWPFIAQMNPDAGTRAVGDTLDFNLADLPAGQQRTLRWRDQPIFIARRTADMLAAMQEKSFVALLADPGSERRQQPAYARNWHRSIDPAYAVMVGICTSCACVPQYFAEASALSMAGGYICPCCASHYDPAGRAHSGPARYNLPVPPHQLLAGPRIVIGRNMSGETFSLDLIERI